MRSHCFTYFKITVHFLACTLKLPFYACTANPVYIILKWHLHVSFRPVGTVGAGGFMVSPSLDRSVNPISTEGGQMMPTTLLFTPPPRIFRLSFGSDKDLTSCNVHICLCIFPLLSNKHISQGYSPNSLVLELRVEAIMCNKFAVHHR